MKKRKSQSIISCITHMYTEKLDTQVYIKDINIYIYIYIYIYMILNMLKVVKIMSIFKYNICIVYIVYI